MRNDFLLNRKSEIFYIVIVFFKGYKEHFLAIRLKGRFSYVTLCIVQSAAICGAHKMMP